ncbi:MULTISPECIES: hypothetical protein [Ruegeria]|uniref:Pilus assembly protein PilP n=2 Tax=Ruegeria TaxID=97050 RepID=A0A6B2NJJ9_9RHOB|nr:MULTISPECIES: hypothetical protein [unclassified Ruegeria]MCU9839505.1 hypothetical protein [Ruegeria sp. WL0004]NDW44352.1 hypothetical protein [Ruegeria sp. PrR005]
MANSKVSSAATQAADIQKNALTVLGIFGPTDDMRALVRLPGGKVEQVAPGDKLRAGEILAIDDEGLMLRHGGQTRRLAIPGS